jgi:glycosyltransferase involved in cell wall biosynthesis
LAVRAIRHFLAQTYPNLEVVVSVDVCTDDTFERVSEFKDSRLTIYRQTEPQGMVGNFDFCLRHATGEYFILIGDDDVLRPEAIERLMQPFLQGGASFAAKDVGLTWCPCRIVGVEGAEFWRTVGGPPTESPASFLKELWSGARGPRFSSIIVRTADALAAGGYQQRHGDMCDIGNYGQAALMHPVVVCVDEYLVDYTNHHKSCTSNSLVRQWQDWARTILDDFLALTRSRNDVESERILRSARRNFLSSITLTILIQTIGKPGWVKNAIRESLREPGIVFTPYMFRRLLADGWKVLRVRKPGEAPQPGAMRTA